MDAHKLFSIREAAEKFGIKPKTLYTWIYSREIGCVRLGRGGRTIRIPSSEIERLCSEGTVPAAVR